MRNKGKSFIVTVKKRSKLNNSDLYINYQKDLYQAYDDGLSVLIAANKELLSQYIGKIADYDKAINAFVARNYPAKASWRYV